MSSIKQRRHVLPPPPPGGQGGWGSCYVAVLPARRSSVMETSHALLNHHLTLTNIFIVLVEIDLPSQLPVGDCYCHCVTVTVSLCHCHCVTVTVSLRLPLVLAVLLTWPLSGRLMSVATCSKRARAWTTWCCGWTVIGRERTSALRWKVHTCSGGQPPDRPLGMLLQGQSK
jgi:hypothetical protein